MAKKASKMKKYLSKRNVLIFCVVAMAAVGLAIYLVYRDGANNETNKPQEVENFRIKIPNSEEVSRSIEQTEDQTEKAKLYLDLASSKHGEGKVEEALDIATQSIDTKPTRQGYATAGALYKQLGNKEQAIEMFTKALELSDKPEYPDEVSPYNEYTLEIRELKGEL